MASGITTEVKQLGVATVLTLAGKLTLGEAGTRTRAALGAIIAAGSLRVVINLAAVPFVDSAGLGILTLHYSKLKAAGGALKLACAQPRVLQALEVTRLTSLFPAYDTVDLAIASFAVAGEPLRQD